MLEISDILLKQRIRNRLIEFFDLRPPFVDIANFGAFETIDMWHDWVDDTDKNSDFDFFCPPVFVDAEIYAIKHFHYICNAAADVTEQDIFSVKTLKQFSEWVQFQKSAEAAYKLFMERGKFPEDEEVF